jgi:uncharacterized protein
MRITEDVSKILKSYVYIYIDPRTNEPFYIGKGKGDRLFSHLKEISDSRKVNLIKDIQESGYEPKIDIIRYGLSDTEATLVEAALIDFEGKSNLSNLKSGYHKGSFGRINSKEVIMMLTAKPVEVRHKSILFTINSLYRSDMTELDLYETTRGIWVLGENREKAKYAMCVTHGIVREVYKIDKWHPAGTLEYITRPDSDNFKNTNRWEFEGSIAYDIRDEYIGFSVGKGSQNPVRYRINIKSNAKKTEGKIIETNHVEVRHKAILFTINSLYHSDMSELELYETTRGCWRVGKRREKAKYAMSVTHGIVREVYKIEKWHPAGTLKYHTRADSRYFKHTKRWEFEGSIAYDIRDEYVGLSVGKGYQNPVRYRNV